MKTQLADVSPLPVLIYNFPGVVAGLDVNSEMLYRLAKHPNIVGVKLTCGGIAKIARVRAQYEPEQFSALAGQSDWLVPALSVGGTGCITGIANLYPKVSFMTTNILSAKKTNMIQACMKIYDLYVAGKIKEAEALQLELANMEWGFAKGGINGTKWVVAKLQGYAEESAHCRRPYPKYEGEEKRAWILNVVQAFEATEKTLGKRSA